MCLIAAIGTGHVKGGMMSRDMEQDEAVPLHGALAVDEGCQSLQVRSQVIIERAPHQQVGLPRSLAMQPVGEHLLLMIDEPDWRVRGCSQGE